MYLNFYLHPFMNNYYGDCGQCKLGADTMSNAPELLEDRGIRTPRTCENIFVDGLKIWGKVLILELTN